MKHDELEQRLWELEYGLLSDEEAAALREQIAGNSEVAQLHDRVRSRLSLLAEAGRIEAPRIKLRIPIDGDTDPRLAAIPPPPHSAKTSYRIKRVANWTLGIAASLLMGLLGWATWNGSHQDSQKLAENRAIDSQPKMLWIRVDTPARLSQEAKNPVSLSTTDADGTPQPTELKLRVENPSGNDLYSQDVTTDKYGRAVVELPGTAVGTANQLKIVRAGGLTKGLQVQLDTAETQYATHLSTDKPRYRPGEVVRYRSVTLSRFGLKADRDVAVEYQITDPAGQEIAGSKLAGITEHGVGNGELPLSADAAPGQYTVIARSPENIFPEVRRDIAIQKPTTRQYDIDVNWTDNLYAAGSQAQGKLAVRSPSGEPAKDVKLNVRAFVDGRQVELPIAEVTTDAAGNAAVGFALPAQIASSEGDLGIQAGAQDVVWKDIPLQADQVQVDFYPEGGDLTAGVENRVYFHCHDFAGRAVAARGRVLDATDREIATVATQHDGRSAFRFTPEAGAAYSLVIDDPPTIKSKPALPPVVEQSRLVLDAGPGVFEGGSPIPLKLRSRVAPSEFALVAYCRGVTVGHQTGIAPDFVNGVCEVNLPVVAEASGVLRVTVFDYSKQPPEPLAERLVYRHPQRKLQLQLAGLSPEYATGDPVRGQVVATDEMGKPVSTVLGISAVDETILALADRPAPRMAAQFLLLGDVDRAEKLEDANLYLSTNPSAAVALDLLLGTQGWRRFDRIPISRMAGSYGYSREGLVIRGDGGGVDFGDTKFGKQLADGEIAEKSIDALGLGRVGETTLDAPRRFDNRAELEALERTTTDFLAEQSQPDSIAPVKIFRGWIVIACLGLLVVLGVAVVVRRHPTKQVVFSGVAVVGGLCIIILAVFFATGGWQAQPGNAAVGLQSDDVRSLAKSAPPPTAPADKKFYFAEEAVAPQAEPASPKIAPIIADPQPLLPKPESAAPAPASTTPSTPAPVPDTARPATPVPAERSPPPSPVVTPDAPKPPESMSAAGVAGGLTAPGGSPSVKLKQEKGDAPLSEADAMQRRLDRKAIDQQKSPDADKEWRKKSATRRVVDNGVESKNLSDSALLGGKTMGGKAMAGKELESAGAQKPDRRELAPPTLSRTERKQTESLMELEKRFTVRRFANLRAKDSRDRSGKDYSESVLWNPLVITDEQGRAAFEFDLPDTVTRFRITADGHAEGRVGGAEQSIAAEPKN